MPCLETDGLGYEVFNVANADMSVAATTQEVQDRFYDEVQVRRQMGRDETFYAIDKARDPRIRPTSLLARRTARPRGRARLSAHRRRLRALSGAQLDTHWKCCSGREAASIWAL